MSAVSLALAVAIFAVGLVLAQLAVPATPLYHTWQYALALGIALVTVLAHARTALRADGATGKRLAVALAGAAIVAVSGLASGLLGPDTATVVGTPGTVDPIPAVAAAAFFAPADASAIARGDAAVTLRRRGAASIVLTGDVRRLLGESLVFLTARPAAAIEARDPHGAHLTVTQPTNAAFLSSVLVFRDRQRIGPSSVPLDTFATPARHRVFRALYFTPRDLAAFGHAGLSVRGPSLILTAADDAGRPLGIALAASGRAVDLGGETIVATIGSYPALTIAAAPEPWALVGGLVLFLGGLSAVGFAALAQRRATASLTASSAPR